jgi:hypothetical protein
VLKSRQRIEAILSAERKTIAKRKRKKRNVYQLMREGSRELDAAGDTVLFIEPSTGYTGLRGTDDLLGTLEGDVRVCDPYVDKNSLDMLAQCESADSIRLLTHNVKQSHGFKQALKPFTTQYGITIDVRCAQPGILHDRYAIDDGSMLMFGTSLNGIGLKQTLVVAIGRDMRSIVLAAFEATWDAATPL